MIDKIGVWPVPVLPQSFDTSLSYYELLAKVTETLNAATALVNELAQSVQELSESIGSYDDRLEAVEQTAAGAAAAVAAEEAARTAEDAAIRQELTQDVASLAAQIAYNGTQISLLTDYLGGLSFRLMTAEEYAQITPTADTIYFVTFPEGTRIILNGETLNAAVSGASVAVTTAAPTAAPIHTEEVE